MGSGRRSSATAGLMQTLTKQSYIRKLMPLELRKIFLVVGAAQLEIRGQAQWLRTSDKAINMAENKAINNNTKQKQQPVN